MEAQGMVEMVAKAIAHEAEPTTPWERCGSGFREICTDYAIAAIKAMREPTLAMKEAYSAEANVGFCPIDPDLVWQAGIDAALNEHQEK